MSLAPVMLDGREISKRFVIAEQTVRTREFALVTPDYAWRWDQTRRRSELFDRRQDPLQQNNLARKLPHIAEKMHRKLLTELAPVRYLAGKKLGQVLLRELPVDMHVARVAFVDGPVLEGYRATAKNRQLRLELFFRPRSIAQGTRYKVAVRIKDPSGAIIGQSSDYVTKGVYPPPRWRTVDRVRHVGRIKLSRDLPRGSSLCVEMKVDQRRLAIEAAGSGRACVGLRFADDL